MPLRKCNSRVTVTINTDCRYSVFAATLNGYDSTMTPVLCVGRNKHGHNSRITSPVTYTTTFHIQKMRRSEYLLVLSRISEQTAIISLYSINWLVLITQTESVYCAARNGYSNKIQEKFLFKGRTRTQAVYRRSLTAEARIRFHAYPCEICGGQSGTGTIFFSVSTSFLSCQYHSTSASYSSPSTS